MNIKDLKASVSLREYVEANSSIDLSQYTTTSNYIVYRNCPFCNHHDHFAIYNDSDRFCSFSGCFQGNTNKNTGDILDFIMHHENVDEDRAVEILKAYIGDAPIKKRKITKLSEEKIMNNNEIKYNNKQYDFTEDCLRNIAIGTKGMDYYSKRGLTDKTVQSYMLGYTDSFNNFLVNNKELQKPEFFSADVYNYVIPNVAVLKNDDGSYNTYIDYIMFRADEDKMNAINKANKEKGKNFSLKKYKKVIQVDTLFNERYLNGELPDKFNLIKYKDTNTLYIVEGQFDALIIEQNQYHAISLNSVNNINKFIDIVKDNLDKLSDIKFKIMFDNDDSGIAATNKMKTELDKLKLDSEIIQFSKKYHDVNDFYLEEKDDFLELLDSKNSLNNSNSYIDAEMDFLDSYFDEIMTAEEDTCIPTGFNKLDTALGGGLFPGVYVLGGTPGAGKTAMANVFADKVAEGGNLACVFSLELSKKEVVNRSISQISFSKTFSGSFNMIELESNALTMNDMKRHHRLNSNVKKVAILRESFDYYKNKIAPNKIIVKQDIIGTSAIYIRNIVQDIITKENRKPFVVVDYLQKLKSDSSGDSISAISDNIAMLKQLAIDFEIPILVITSYNRVGYLSGANMSQGKGSGDIEYTADCMIAAQLKGCGEEGFNQKMYDELMEKDIRELELVFLKNRNWKVGIKTELSYIPSFNVVEEN